MIRTVTDRIILFLVTLLLFSFGWHDMAFATMQARAQQLFVANPINNAPYPVKDYKDMISELNQLILLEAEGKSRKDILEEIALKANLGLAYNPEIEVLEKRISFSERWMSVGKALMITMEGTEYEPAISRTREIVLNRNEQTITIDRLQVSVTGVITDSETAEPIPGVNILVKGTTTGTTTDLNGVFEFPIPSLDDTLVISYVGYQNQEIALSGRTDIEVQLVSEAIVGEEMVVVAYGEQSRINLTGSIDAVRGDVFENRSANQVSDLIKGTSPNLNIEMGMRGGEPGSTSSWNIRGMGSLSGNSAPLILVDGVEMNINNIDPETIEGVSILKDASASAIYGSRAPFGVVLITTKRGQPGEGVRIQYSNNLSMNSPMNIPSFVDSYTWATAYNQASANSGATDIYSSKQMQRIQDYMNGVIDHEYDPDNPIDNVFAGRREGNANYDWPNVMIRDYSYSQKHNINVSGGNEQTQYYVSGGFSDQEGIYEFGHDAYDRYNFLTNLNTQVKHWIALNTSLKYSRDRTD